MGAENRTPDKPRSTNDPTVEAGCLFALDSDAHTADQLSYAETAMAHARLTGIPVDRIVNCWPVDRLLAWLSNPTSERRT
jgi:putative hydrolase